MHLKLEILLAILLLELKPEAKTDDGSLSNLQIGSKTLKTGSFSPKTNVFYSKTGSNVYTKSPQSQRRYRIGASPFINEIVTEWSQWGHWGKCSRSCGGGVTSRKRTCISRYPRVMPGSGIRTSHSRCTGQGLQYQVCGIESCPAGQVSAMSFRSAQCRHYNNKRVLGRVVNYWVPYHQGGINPCALVCEGVGEGVVYTFGKVTDGTNCKTDAGRTGLCVNGRCLHLSCDGRLGGLAEEDMCRVCGGNNNTCTKHIGVYHYELPSADQPFPGSGVGLLRKSKSRKSFGYYEVAKIPKGATNVKIIDNSSNFLALKSVNKYLLNGDWLIDWPGEVEAGGTPFSYSRGENEAETLRTIGPTKDDLMLMVLLREHNPGIYYEYWIPNSPLTGKKYSQLRVKPPVTLPPRKNTSTTTTSVVPTANPSTLKPAVFTSLSFNNTIARMKIKENKNKTSDRRKNLIYNSSSDKDKDNVVRSNKKGRKNKKKYSKRKKKKKKRRPDNCEPCSKKRAKVAFCTSDFVSLVKITSEEIVDDYRRLEATVLQSYKNTIPLSHKEYLWQHICSCRRLRTSKTYIVMGHSASGKGREVKLVLNQDDYVRKFSEKVLLRVRKFRHEEMKVCSSWRRDFKFKYSSLQKYLLRKNLKRKARLNGSV